MSLFEGNHQAPLAKRMVPKNFDEYEGQEHLVGINKPIRTMVARKIVQSMVFYGPPASGKTGLAQLIARDLEADFISVNALNLNSDDIRKIHSKAQYNQDTGKKTVLFIDEIHRMTRPKQDVFLESLESGLIILIGATTENPYFSLQPALRSRILIFEFFPLSKEHLKNILYRAFEQDSFLKELDIKLDKDGEEFLVQASSDPRNMLTVLETAVLSQGVGSLAITKSDIETILQKTDTVYDNESAHYDTISAFIKSIRGSDPNAALYYLAVMIESGEDPRFIFRRLLISAVEDVGLAAPDAISVVQSCAEAFERVGFPEGTLLLSHATLFLVGLPKSNSVLSIFEAQSFVKQGNILAIPKHLQDAHYQGAKDLGRGLDYLYPHDYPEHFVKQEYLSQEVSFYKAKSSGFEKKVKERLERLWGKDFSS